MIYTCETCPFKQTLQEQEGQIERVRTLSEEMETTYDGMNEAAARMIFEDERTDVPLETRLEQQAALIEAKAAHSRAARQFLDVINTTVSILDSKECSVIHPEDAQMQCPKKLALLAMGEILYGNNEQE